VRVLLPLAGHLGLRDFACSRRSASQSPTNCGELFDNKLGWLKPFPQACDDRASVKEVSKRLKPTKGQSFARAVACAVLAGRSRAALRCAAHLSVAQDLSLAANFAAANLSFATNQSVAKDLSAAVDPSSAVDPSVAIDLRLGSQP
jgi:hypothetical protein